MGICERITNEAMMKDSPMQQIDSESEVGRSICKIETPKKVGTGFFIKLYKNGNHYFH